MRATISIKIVLERAGLALARGQCARRQRASRRGRQRAARAQRFTREGRQAARHLARSCTAAKSRDVGEEEKPWPQRVPPQPRAPDKPGLNRFAWNLRYPEVQGFAGMVDILTSGPIALPGRYWVRLHVGSWVDSASFMLKEDPRVKATPADLAAQFAFLEQMRDTVNAGTTAIITIRNVRAQLDDRLASVHGADSTALAPAAAELRDSLVAAEQRLYQIHLRADEDALNYPAAVVERISALSAQVSAVTARPTDQQVGVFRQFAPVLQKNLAAYKRVLAVELPKMNEKLQKLGKPAIRRRRRSCVRPRRWRRSGKRR